MTSYTPEELYESAMNYFKLGDRPTAVMHLQEAIMAKPDYHEAYNNRANILLQLGNNFDAVLNYDRAISMSPRTPEYHNNRGAALMELNAYDDAEKSYLHAIDLKPHFEQAQMNLGNVLKIKGRVDEARAAYERSIKANPDYIDAHLHLAFMALEVGDYATGWREFEYRWKSGQVPERGLPYPRWEGQPVDKDDGILLYAEQGLGDAIQFCRYAPLVKERYGCKVYVEVRAQLTRIVKTMKGIDGVITFAEQPPADVKYCAPLMSCPLFLGTTVETIPSPQPYLFADKGRADWFDPSLAQLKGGVRVGICWAGYNRAGNPGAAAIDRRRSMLLSQFAPLGLVSNISWVSLQKGPPSDQVKEPPKGMTILHCMEECDDFADTAALISKLDLVISVDTSVAHLAAAIGVPTWILSRHDACWRWFGSRRDSPWYAAVTHFRQKKPGDWDSLMLDVAIELRKFVKAKGD